MPKPLILTAALFLLSFAEGKAQTAESDSLFAAGVELYRVEKYFEAIPLFAQCDSIDKATLPEGSARRAYSSWWLASCYYLLGDTAIAQTISDYYMADPVDRRLTVESDSLANLAGTALGEGDLQSAVQYAIRCAEIEKNVVGEQHIWYGNSAEVIALLYCAMGDYTSATKYEQIALSVKGQRFWEKLIKIASSWHKQAALLYNDDHYAEALQLEKQVWGLRARVLYQEHPDYTVTLNTLAVYNYYNGCYEEAINLRTKALNIEGNIYGKESEKYAISLQEIAQYNSKLYHWDKAVSLETEALNIYGKVYGKESKKYAKSLRKLALYNFKCGNYDGAAHRGAEALTICEKVYGRESEEYFITASNLATYYDICMVRAINSNKQDYMAETKDIIEEALDVCEKVYGKNTTQYAKTLKKLVEYYKRVDYTETLRLSIDALPLYKDVYGKVSEEYSNLLFDIAEYNTILYKFEEALRYCKEGLDIVAKLSGHDSDAYANRLIVLAECYSDVGKDMEAIRLTAEALNIREKINGKESWEYASALDWLGTFYSRMGRYSECLSVSKEALSIYKDFYNDENYIDLATMSSIVSCNCSLGNYKEALKSCMEWKQFIEYVNDEVEPDSLAEIDYLLSLSQLAHIHTSLGNDSIAHKLYSHVVEICERYCRDSDYYGWSLENLSGFYYSIGDTKQAADIQAQAVDVYERCGEASDYGSSLYTLSLYNYRLHDYKKAVLQCNKALDTFRNSEHLKFSGDVARALFLLSYCYLEQNDTKALCLTALEASEMTRDLLLLDFRDLPAFARTDSWHRFNYWFEEDVHEFAYRLSSETFSALGYNGVLLSKGLLLNSEIEFSKLIKESGDSEVIAMYDDLRTLRLQIIKLLEKPISERFANVDSLEWMARAKEQQLLDSSKVYGDFTKNLVITWDQVQEKLTDKDAAVEFVSFPWNADSTMYIAYVLRKDWDCPRMIPLFEEKELEAVEGYDYYTTPSVSHLVWEPLEKVLEGADHVYFSPGGDLYNIAIESVPDHLDPAHIVSERRNYYRLSSTRELALIQDDYTWTEGAVYGGLNYNMGVSSLAADEAHYAQSASEGQRKRGIDLSYYYLGREGFAEGIRSDRKSSGLLDSLPGTREEAVAIKAQLDDISVPSSLYTDDLGTEASFKALDGQRTSIIHIGTHGFFNTKKAEYQDMSSLLMTSDQQTVRVEDDALSRSGLCMAGANNLLSRTEALPDSLDDGWLTALEIAHLDLRGLDMVVLSACKTGVGEVTGDGVFGLQRGFKKAGARTLVMSLWNVPDQLTCYFMKEFFARISVDANGHPTNKHAAFLQAQQAARTNWRKVDPHAAPYDWAAFILLDGVD